MESQTLQKHNKLLMHGSGPKRLALGALKCSAWQALGENMDLEMGVDFSKLKRSKHPMPDFVRKALNDSGLMGDYHNRPAYQQNDYIGWIEKAKREETKIKRLAQMLNELEVGGIYMKMKHPASQKNKNQ